MDALTWKTGGYSHTYRPTVAGRWGCDPCWGCDQRPAAGARVWLNSYGDLWCDPCATRRAGHNTGVSIHDGMRQHTNNEQELARLIAHLDTEHGVTYRAERDLVRVQTVHAAEHAALLDDIGRG
jgi:hypothetical protein